MSLSVYLELLSYFLPFKIHWTNISPILIKMVDFKNLAWATSFANRAGGKFIYLPYRANGKKSYCHTLVIGSQEQSQSTVSTRASSWFQSALHMASVSRFVLTQMSCHYKAGMALVQIQHILLHPLECKNSMTAPNLH